MNHAEPDNPAERLRAAAFQLRNPFHLPGLDIAVDPDIARPLADWLDAEAETWAGDEVHSHCTPRTCTSEAALAVARAVQPEPPHETATRPPAGLKRPPVTSSPAEPPTGRQAGAEDREEGTR